MSKLSDYKELFCDGARLELSGQRENARLIYCAVVKKCAYSDTLGLDTLEEIYGDNAYSTVDTYERAIECATVALCCKALVEIVARKFHSRDRLVNTAEKNTADITSFFKWLSEHTSPCSKDYKVLKQTVDVLLLSDKVLLPSSCKDSQRTLLELIEGFVTRRLYL